MDGSARICELVQYHLEEIDVKGVWTGPGALALHPHALAPVAELPVLEVVSTVHLVADLTLGLGKVVHDYLEPQREMGDVVPIAGSANMRRRAAGSAGPRMVEPHV